MKTLIIVDIQNDFVPGGALAVKEGDEIVPRINELQPSFDLVVATQDWHPADHGSFAVHHPGKKPGELIDLHGLTQVLWPVHCVQGTEGAAFVEELNTDQVEKVFVKGTDSSVDSYSGFFDNGRRNSTGLGDFLKEKGASEVYVVGLATDYCVKFTALDAASLGYKTYLIEDACRGVELNPGDIDQALADMEAAGVRRISSKLILS
ncbi:MAG: bifunctional nicotinamidase/pyrazinamidase [Bacteroidota bacterium]